MSSKTHPFPLNLATKGWKKLGGNLTLKLSQRIDRGNRREVRHGGHFSHLTVCEKQSGKSSTEGMALYGVDPLKEMSPMRIQSSPRGLRKD